MGLYHSNPLTGQDLMQAIGNPVNVCSFANNPRAEGASVTNHFSDLKQPEAQGPATSSPSFDM